jgi:hypothetical protein
MVNPYIKEGLCRGINIVNPYIKEGLCRGINLVNPYIKEGLCRGINRVKSVPITTKVVSLNPVHGKVYLIQHYVIKL